MKYLGLILFFYTSQVFAIGNCVGPNGYYTAGDTMTLSCDLDNGNVGSITYACMADSSWIAGPCVDGDLMFDSGVIIQSTVKKVKKLKARRGTRIIRVKNK